MPTANSTTATPFELLCATILSAQCTDVRVNLVTPELFRRYPDAESLAVARPEDVEALIRPTGFFRNKTKSLIGMANAGGRAPWRPGSRFHGGPEGPPRRRPKDS